MKKGIKVNLKRKADATKDDFLQGFLDRINKAKTDKEKLTILDSIYSKKTELHVIVGVFSGVVNDVEVFSNEDDADDHEKQLCKKYDVPYDAKERAEYYDSAGEHEIKHFTTELR